MVTHHRATERHLPYGSHSVTCHPTQVNVPRLNPSHAGWYSVYVAGLILLNTTQKVKAFCRKRTEWPPRRVCTDQPHRTGQQNEADAAETGLQTQ